MSIWKSDNDTKFQRQFFTPDRQISNIKYQISNIKYQISNIKYQISNIKYHGEFSPSNLAFNSNLQEFAQQVSYLCNLEANGKISPEATYTEIKQLWQQLEQSKQELLDNTNFTPDE